MKGVRQMTNIEQKRKQFDKFLISKDFNLSDGEVIEKALEFEKSAKKSQAS